MDSSINKNVLKGYWTEMKGDLQKQWARITDNEFEETKGEMKAIKGLIQKRYGRTQVNVEGKLAEIYDRYQDKKSKVMSKIKKSI